MATLHKLNAKQIEAAKEESTKIGDGGGLWFWRRKGGSAQWTLRYTVHGRRREMSLGGYPNLSLKAARVEAERWRTLAKAGKDPVKLREKERRDAERNMHLLADVALDAFESRRAELKGGGKAGRWFSPLELHVMPRLGKVPVAEIDQIDIRDTLKPIWHTKAVTARKAMARLGIVLKHGAALGLNVDLQAIDKAKALLGAQRHSTQHIPAMRWQDTPDFYSSLKDGTTTHLGLRLLILTGVRTFALRHAHLDQFSDRLWTIPAAHMKGREGTTTDFRIPLSDEALRVVNEAKAHERAGWLFVGPRGKPISDMTLSRYMERRELEARPHGFRTSLRTWTAECTDAPHEVAETVLAHSSGSKVVDAYRRTDFLEQRRILMDRWAEHLTGGAGHVVALHG